MAGLPDRFGSGPASTPGWPQRCGWRTCLIEEFDSTPRLALLSPEPGSDKTRALEVIGSRVRHPMHAINATPAAVFRSVADLDRRPTIEIDEIDTIFGPKAKDNEEVRGYLNAGHRRSGVAYRCVGLGSPSPPSPRSRSPAWTTYPPRSSPGPWSGCADAPPTHRSSPTGCAAANRGPGPSGSGWPTSSTDSPWSTSRTCPTAWSTAQRTCGSRYWPSPRPSVSTERFPQVLQIAAITRHGAGTYTRRLLASQPPFGPVVEGVTCAWNASPS